MAEIVKRLVFKAVPASALILILCCAASAQTYPVRLTRPWKAGDRYRITATGSLSQKSSTSVNDRVHAHTLNQTVDFLADATVLQIRPDGRIAKESLTVNQSLVSGDSLRRQLVPRGTVVTITAEQGRLIFRINGEQVSGEIEDELSLVISLEAGETSNDDVFGTPTRRHMGESWESILYWRRAGYTTLAWK
jgi:hypothetical protein